MFIRFIVASRDPRSGRRQGLFEAAAQLRASGRLSHQDELRLDELQQWFGENLPVPNRFSLSARPHRKAQALSWFRDTATEQIARMREYLALLERYGFVVEMLREKRPGYVVYEDEYQVAAYPFSDTDC
jgi:hypothetical protein